MQSWMILRDARQAAGLTQSELAERLGTTQPAIAALERPGSNPRIRTLERALAATGNQLELGSRDIPDVDETQIRERLALSPAERLASFQASQRNLNALLRKARRVPRTAS
jgi:transcriptional regulator with XRE-family HTH domain